MLELEDASLEKRDVFAKLPQSLFLIKAKYQNTRTGKQKRFRCSPVKRAWNHFSCFKSGDSSSSQHHQPLGCRHIWDVCSWQTRVLLCAKLLGPQKTVKLSFYVRVDGKSRRRQESWRQARTGVTEKSKYIQSTDLTELGAPQRADVWETTPNVTFMILYSRWKSLDWEIYNWG